MAVSGRAAAQSPDAVSADELSRRKLAVAVADAQVARATADLKLWQAGAWEPDRKIAAATVTQAEAQVRQTEIEIERLTVAAPRFGWKIVFDLTYFIIINTIILNIVFGIIVDTFGDMRDE